MANHERGEVDFEVDGNAYTLRLDCNAMANVQSDLGIEADHRALSIMAKLRGFRGMRFMIFRGLERTTKGITLERAGEIVTALGLERTAELSLEALTWAMPKPDPSKVEADDQGKAATRSPGAPPS